MQFKQPDPEDLSYFQNILNPGRVLSDDEARSRCASDQTEDLCFLPALVLQPESAEQVSLILKHCYEQNIAVTPRGAGTGLSGGALPVLGGIVLDMGRMNRILEIDTENFQVTTEPAVITQVLQEAVREKGLYYPPDPASKGSCFIGGNVAENSGGPKALKYGVVKDYVLNLEVVLPQGERIWTGANVLKNSTGYNLTQLIVGSEGTLAVVTKIVLRLIPHPTADLTMLVPFRRAEDACAAVNEIFLAGHTPSALEFMERDALVLTQAYTGSTLIPLPDDVAAHLLIEVDGHDPEQLMQDMEQIAERVAHFDIGEPLLAETKDEKERLWSLRRKVGEAVRAHSVKKEEDTVVPRAKLPALLRFVKDLGKKHGFESVCFGHVGDGNLHVNILRGNLSESFWNDELPLCIRELFEEVQRLGGTLSGEHGIGYVQRRYMDIVFNPAQLQLMRAIKDVFDPKGILNPGKIFPEASGNLP
ncbi:MAG: FAD-binding protein [Bacteroidetes bacterium]|nr:FAD-binding protein [Bacteroidota bacterium]